VIAPMWSETSMKALWTFMVTLFRKSDLGKCNSGYWSLFMSDKGRIKMLKSSPEAPSSILLVGKFGLRIRPGRL
jgi:hypothetical protein